MEHLIATIVRIAAPTDVVMIKDFLKSMYSFSSSSGENKQAKSAATVVQSGMIVGIELIRHPILLG